MFDVCIQPSRGQRGQVDPIVARVSKRCRDLVRGRVVVRLARHRLRGRKQRRNDRSMPRLGLELARVPPVGVDLIPSRNSFHVVFLETKIAHQPNSSVGAPRAPSSWRPSCCPVPRRRPARRAQAETTFETAFPDLVRRSFFYIRLFRRPSRSKKRQRKLVLGRERGARRPSDAARVDARRGARSTIASRSTRDSFFVSTGPWAQRLHIYRHRSIHRQMSPRA